MFTRRYCARAAIHLLCVICVHYHARPICLRSAHLVKKINKNSDLYMSETACIFWKFRKTLYSWRLRKQNDVISEDSVNLKTAKIRLLDE